jgi:hypothetical protein
VVCRADGLSLAKVNVTALKMKRRNDIERDLQDKRMKTPGKPDW